MDRPCFCCGKTLIEDHPEHYEGKTIEHSNWLGATDWSSVGNWCSTVLDCCMDPEYKKATIVICDECYKEREARVILIEKTAKEKAYEKEQDIKAKKLWAEIKEDILKEIKESKKDKTTDLGPGV